MFYSDAGFLHDWLVCSPHDAHQGAVGPVRADRIRDHVSLGLVFVGDAAPVGLVPVDDELLGLAVADEVFADLVALAVDVEQVGVAGGLEGPSGPGQSVLGRMDGLPRALGGEVADEEADRQKSAGSGSRLGDWLVQS